MATWNVQGILTKWTQTLQEIKTMDIDIMSMSETKKKGSGIEERSDYLHIYSGIPKEERAKRGVSLLIKKKYRTNITHFEAIDANIVMIYMNLFGRRLAIFGIYAPNDGESQSLKEDFYNKLQETVDAIGQRREIILLGDFNGRTGSKKQDVVVGQFGENTINDSGERLIEFCRANELRIANGFYQHKNIHKYTWTQPTRQLKSIIDYVITPQKTDIKVNDVRVYRGTDCGSDHHLVISKLQFPYNIINEKDDAKNEEQKLEDTDIEIYNLESLNDESTRFLYKRRLNQKLKERHDDDIEKLHQHIKRAIREAASEALGVVDKKTESKKWWWNNKIAEEINSKKEAYLRWLNTKTEESREVYRERRARVKRMVQEEKRKGWDRKCKEIETYIGGRRCTEAWKFINNIRSDGNQSKLQIISATQWEEHYKKLLTENRVKFLEGEGTVVTVQGEEINLDTDTVLNAIKKLKNHKAPGPGGIYAELIKNGTEYLITLITELFSNCIKKKQTPTEWKIGFMSSLFKKGNRQQCQNYRGITVTPTLSRLYGRIIRDLIEQEYLEDETEEQSGFRAGRSCMDNVFCIKQIIEKRINVNQETHLLFIDLSKAYDNVPVLKLWEVLKNTNINHTLIQVVQEMYKDSRIKIKVGKKVSTGFSVSKGLRQGCCISPTLFKIYVDAVLKQWKRKCGVMGIPVNDTHIFTLQFADDQVLIAQDKDDLEYMTRKIKEEYERWGLSINIDKTKYLCVGDTGSNLKLDNNEEIEICHMYRYLGVHINQDGRDTDEIRERVSMGRRAVKRLNGLWWSDQITKGRKVQIYETIVKNILLYGAEGWRLTEADKKKILAVEMDALRRSCRISRRERRRNEEIREVINVKHTIIEEIEKRQLVWFGHVNRMIDERLPKKVWTWIPPEKRKKGRPRRTWGENVRKAMSERNLTEDQCQDRTYWRKSLEIGQRRQTL